jgi:hypothetical protein
VATTFTFFAEGDRIEVRIVELETRSKVDESDTVWLDSTVTVHAGAFIGSFKASFTTDDLVRLHEQLQSALTTLSGTVICHNTGGGLSLVIKLDSDGRASISGVAYPNRLRRGTLTFQLSTDHFALIRTLRELEGAMGAFPTFQTIKNNGWARNETRTEKKAG